MNHELSVVIVTWNSEDVVGDLLRSLKAGLGRIKSVAVIVVDNASSDATVEVVRSTFPSAICVQLEENRGYAAGVNAGISRSNGGHVLVLNPDIRVSPDAIQRLLNRLQSSEDVGIVVPVITRPSGELIYSLRRAPTIMRSLGDNLLGGKISGRLPALSELVRRPESYREATFAAWATGAAMLIGDACLEDVGPWEEGFFLYSEETDFCLRAGDADYRLVLEPDAHVQHLGGEYRVSPQLYSLLICNRIRLVAKRQGRGVAFAHWLFAVCGEAMRSLTKGSVHRAAVAALLSRRSRPIQIRDAALLGGV